MSDRIHFLTTEGAIPSGCNYFPYPVGLAEIEVWDGVTYDASGFPASSNPVVSLVVGIGTHWIGPLSLVEAVTLAARVKRFKITVSGSAETTYGGITASVPNLDTVVTRNNEITRENKAFEAMWNGCSYQIAKADGDSSSNPEPPWIHYTFVYANGDVACGKFGAVVKVKDTEDYYYGLSYSASVSGRWLDYIELDGVFDGGASDSGSLSCSTSTPGGQPDPALFPDVTDIPLDFTLPGGRVINWSAWVTPYNVSGFTLALDSIVIEPDESWPYKNSAGNNVFNTTTGEPENSIL
jgi:hypothetical protein